MLSNLISRWSEFIVVEIAGTRDIYNQITYSKKTILGRLIFTKGNSRLILKENIDSNYVFYTLDGSITIHSKINGLLVIKKTEWKDSHNMIEYYTYELGAK